MNCWSLGKLISMDLAGFVTVRKVIKVEILRMVASHLEVTMDKSWGSVWKWIML